LPLPYSDDFESYNVGQTARYLTDEGGSFEVAAATVGGDGKVLRQMAEQRGIEWTYNLTPDPYTYMGNADWADYRVSVSAYLGNPAADPAYVVVLGRINEISVSESIRPWPDGYEFYVNKQGDWTIYRSRFRGGRYDLLTLATGSLASFDSTVWHRFAL